MMEDLNFWKTLCPELTISEKVKYIAPNNDIRTDNLNTKLVTEGYFHETFPASKDLPLNDMASCIQRLKDRDMPPVWCFIYDEFWELTAKADAYIKSALGSNYKKLPEMWAWHIDPAKQESGWRPHRDRDLDSINQDLTPKSISIWIPLTDATVDNSCIYMLPICDDSSYLDRNHMELDSKKKDNHKAIPLETKAGEMLGWTQQVLHWGSESKNITAPPRMSVSVEFVSTNEEEGVTDYYRTPWMDPFLIPTLQEKINMIETQIKQYYHMWR
jgi:hypothetical protein